MLRPWHSTRVPPAPRPPRREECLQQCVATSSYRSSLPPRCCSLPARPRNRTPRRRILPRSSAPQPDCPGLITTTVEAARDAVDRTPSLLPVLAEAGVVDAGGMGLLTILEGCRQHITGEGQPVSTPTAEARAQLATAIQHQEEEFYGYCTEILVSGEALEREATFEAIFTLREKLAQQFPNVPRHRADLASARHNQGILLTDRGKFVEAEKALLKGLEIRKELVAKHQKHPGHRHYRQDLGSSHNGLGLLYRESGEWVKAEVAPNAMMTAAKPRKIFVATDSRI